MDIEVKDLGIIFSKASIDTTVMQNPTKAQALSELPKHAIAHFSCQGFSSYNPSQSSLLLEDWKIGPLTVSDLTSLNMEFASLAYLSACHTSAMRNLDLLDEPISLSSAIQLAGYPSVVGSLWQVGDSRSAEVARHVYRWILGDVEFDARRAAEGLHKAVRCLRDQTRFHSECDPLAWASYIYVGI